MYTWIATIQDPLGKEAMVQVQASNLRTATTRALEQGIPRYGDVYTWKLPPKGEVVQIRIRRA